MTLLPVVLPEGFAPKVSVNDKLTAGDIIAEKKGKGAEEAVNVSQILKDSPKKMTKFFKKNLGDSVSKGEIIAVKKGTLGFGTKKIISEFSGTVVKIDTETGNVVIHVTGGQDSLQKLISPVDGTVDFCDNEKIVIKTEKDALICEEAVGEDVRGLLFVIEAEQVGFLEIKGELTGKIVLGKNFEKGTIYKAFGLGATGIIGIEIKEGDFEELREKGIKSPVARINGDNYKKLLKHKNSEIYLDPKNKSVVIL